MRYILLREIQPVVLQRLQEAVLHRQSFHFVVRFLTLRKQDLTEYLEMQSIGVRFGVDGEDSKEANTDKLRYQLR